MLLDVLADLSKLFFVSESRFEVFGFIRYFLDDGTSDLALRVLLFDDFEHLNGLPGVFEAPLDVLELLWQGQVFKRDFAHGFAFRSVQVQG